MSHGREAMLLPQAGRAGRWRFPRIASITQDFGRRYIDSPRFRPRSLAAYLVATVIVAASTVLRLAVAPWVVGMPFFLFFPAVIVATMVCGSTAGFLAAILSISSAYMFVVPYGRSMEVVSQAGLFGVGAIAVVGVVAVMRSANADVRRLNLNLQQSEGKFRSLLEAAPDAMIIVDAESRIALVNAATERLFGYRRAELLGEPIDMLMPEPAKGRYDASSADSGASGAASPAMGAGFELIGVRKDKVELPIEVSRAVLQTESGAMVSSVIRDATARKQIEAKIAVANRAKSDFLGSMSHELRTPLNAVIGFSQLLQLGRRGALSEEQKEYLGYVLDNANQMLDLVTQLLDFASLGENSLSLSLEEVRMSEVLAAVYDAMSPLAQKSRIVFEVDAPHGSANIRADKTRLLRVLSNLVSNAIKYTCPGGSVTLGVQQRESFGRFTVSDNGVGIAPERHEELFQPFQRRDVDCTTGSGVGVGLALSRKLVEAMGGAMGFSSVPGNGSVFWLELPMGRNAADVDGDHLPETVIQFARA